MAHLHPHASNEAAPNNTREPDPLSQPLPPDVILYKANVLADPSLWDSNFGVTSLFGTNKFLQNNVNNMAMSLLHMATFLNQRKLDNQDGNDSQQLSSFGDTTWQFISAIYESSWDSLYAITPYHSLCKISGIFHCNNQNNWLKRRVWPPRDVL